MPNARILLVEDDHLSATYLEKALMISGYEVTTVVASGELAVQAAAADPPDVVLMDIMLPGKIDGIEAAVQIRARQDLPIIYLTAYADGDLSDRVKATEPFGYLLKPFQEQELRLAIDMTLYKHKLETDLREANRRLEQEIAERKRTEEELRQFREHLEELVEDRTARLQQEITERKRAEEALQYTKNALEIANQRLEERIQEELEKYQKQQQLLIQRSKLEALGKTGRRHRP